MANLRALKVLVAGMGVLIVAGTGLLVYGLVAQGTREERTPQNVGAAATGATDGASPRAFGTLSLGLVPGERIVDASIAQDRLAVIVETLDGTRSIRLVDIATGMPIGRVTE